MAIEFAADNIRVNAILPGAVDTPMLRAGLGAGTQALAVSSTGSKTWPGGQSTDGSDSPRKSPGQSTFWLITTSRRL